MQRLKGFLVGVALTCFSADYLRMKAQWHEMESVTARSLEVASQTQVTTTSCLVELAYNKSLIESWSERSRIVTLARTETLVTIDRARDGDAEALLVLKDLGYSMSNSKKLIMMHYGIGGP